MEPALGPLLTRFLNSDYLPIGTQVKENEKFEVRVAQHLGKINHPSFTVGSVQPSRAWADCFGLPVSYTVPMPCLKAWLWETQGTHLSENRYIRQLLLSPAAAPSPF